MLMGIHQRLRISNRKFHSPGGNPMKQRSILLVLVVALLAVCVPPVFGQATGSVKGVCKDQNGAPITGATVEWFSQETGRKYTLKTNGKGEYFSLGIAPGKYKVTLSKD